MFHGSPGRRHSHDSSSSGCIVLVPLFASTCCADDLSHQPTLLQSHPNEMPPIMVAPLYYLVSSLTSIHLNPLVTMESTLVYWRCSAPGYTLYPPSFVWQNLWRLASDWDKSISQEGPTSGSLQLSPNNFHLNYLQSVWENRQGFHRGALPQAAYLTWRSA